MKALAELIIENPDLPVVTMTDVVFDSVNDEYVAGNVCEAHIDYIYSKADGDWLTHKERPYFKSFDEDYEVEAIQERILHRDFTMDMEDDELKKEAEKIWNNLSWRQVIVVYAGELKTASDIDKEFATSIKEETE
ncbi:hypothetical protein HB834_05965 [Listeria booriae]|uniref:hypothetical protein n=1 Tax=Listeria booriae TaxID=1552123 RepID=UPI00164E6940|nr:hypothetical protein [Listeria booriae]MBC6151063.1 hypothetical protein [Listeria booriae]MBC6151188.1 hypothetical protein [Listeria booriae]